MPANASEIIQRYPVQAGTIPRRLMNGREESGPINPMLIHAAPGPRVAASVFEPDPGFYPTASSKLADSRKRPTAEEIIPTMDSPLPDNSDL